MLMEREDRNPFVTRIELDQTKRRIENTLREEIRAVDDKHSENHVVVRELLARSNVTMEHLIKSSDRTTTAVEKMTDEMRESQKEKRLEREQAVERIRTLEAASECHTEIIAQRKEIMDGKRESTLKWIGTFVPVFVVFISGIFGIVESLILFLLDKQE